MSWFGFPATEKQLSFIERIENTCGKPYFTGTTRKEASEYIDKMINRFRGECALQHCEYGVND